LVSGLRLSVAVAAAGFLAAAALATSFVHSPVTVVGHAVAVARRPSPVARRPSPVARHAVTGVGRRLRRMRQWAACVATERAHR
jgi:hypothetical protein